MSSPLIWMEPSSLSPRNMVDTPSPSLLGLPGELRNRVYEFLAPEVTWFSSRSAERARKQIDPSAEAGLWAGDAMDSPRVRSHPVFQICHQLRHEWSSFLHSPLTSIERYDFLIADFNFETALRFLHHMIQVASADRPVHVKLTMIGSGTHVRKKEAPYVLFHDFPGGIWLDHLAFLSMEEMVNIEFEYALPKIKCANDEDECARVLAFFDVLETESPWYYFNKTATHDWWVQTSAVIQHIRAAHSSMKSSHALERDTEEISAQMSSLQIDNAPHFKNPPGKQNAAIASAAVGPSATPRRTIILAKRYYDFRRQCAARFATKLLAQARRSASSSASSSSVESCRSLVAPGSSLDTCLESAERRDGAQSLSVGTLRGGVKWGGRLFRRRLCQCGKS